jgi:hypothetical protein
VVEFGRFLEDACTASVEGSGEILGWRAWHCGLVERAIGAREPRCDMRS